MVSFDTVVVAPTVGAPVELVGLGEAVGANVPLQGPIMSHAAIQSCPVPGANQRSLPLQKVELHL